MMRAGDDQVQTSVTLSPLRATGIVGMGSIASLLLSVVTAKAFALLVGPTGVGLLALMQSTIIVGVMIGSLGLATSAVRAIAAASEAPRGEAHAVIRSASLVGYVGGLVAAMVLIAIREPLAEIVLGTANRSPMFVILGVALGFAIAASVQVALLTGLHRVRRVVMVNVVTSAAAAAFGIALVAALGEDGLAPGVLATAAVQFALARAFVVSERRSFEPPSATELHPRRIGTLISSGLPVAAGQLAGSGALYLVPVIVLQVLQTDEVGYYRAAAAISIGYLTFFLAALTQDFYPRLGRNTDQVPLSVLIERRMRLLLALGVPLIVGLLATGPLLIQVLYTAQFAPAYAVLQWQLIGDLLRLPAWVFLFVLLSRASTGSYLRAELAGGVSLLVGSYLGIVLLGLVGAGMGYALSQLVYFVASWLLVRRYVATTPGRLQGVVLATAALASLVVLAPLPLSAKSALLGAAALVFAAVAWPRLYRLHQRGEL